MKIAVVNRGEAAVRFLRALDEYNLERGTQHKSVALYTDTDAEAPFVHLADQAVPLGPALRTNRAGSLVNAYLDHDHLLELLRHHHCDAVWPGWGFVSEDPQFVARLEQAGILFIGPSSEAMQRLGDKIESKRLAEQFEVPVSPWLVIEGQPDEVLLAEAARIGYPLMVKASAGGGGRGIRKVDHPSGLLSAIEAARNEVARIFSAGGLFMEACVTGARHIEVQLAVDHQGKAYAVGVRDCSIQRRNQKVIEEAPSAVLSPEDEAFVCAAATRLAEGAGYRNVGTAEFLFRMSDRRFFFLEVNSRLQVEHTITELTTGNDMVKAQLDIAQGILWKPVGPGRGHAIEVRLNAEDPDRGFQPAPGLLRVFEPPAGPGIRIDSGVREGISIAPEFDSMIAKVMAYGATRQEAIARMIRALKQFPVVVEDGATNKAFLLRLLTAPPYLDASASTRWLDEAMAAGELKGGQRQLDAVLTASILVHKRTLAAEIQRYFAEVQEGIPQRLRPPGTSSVKLAIAGKPVTAEVQEVGPHRYDVRLGEDSYRVEFDQSSLHRAFLHVEGRRDEVLFGVGKSGIYVEVEGEGYVIEERSGGVVRAPAPAMIVSVSVQEGAVVQPGDRLATLEAMKMEIPLYAQEGGRIVSVRCQANQQVAAGQVIMTLQPEGAQGEVAEVVVRLGAPPTPGPLDVLRVGQGWDVRKLDALTDDEATDVVDALVSKLQAILLGYDHSEEQILSLVRLFEGDEGLASLNRPERLLPLVSALAAFTDSEALFERSLVPAPGQATLINTEAAFYEFCRAHHRGEEAARGELALRLKRALQHHGVGKLEPGPELRSALWRFAVGHAHTGPRHRAVSALLRALIQLKGAGAIFERVPLAEQLEAVVHLSDRRFPFVSDNARQASYELFLRERFVQQQSQVEAALDETLAKLADAQLVESARAQVIRRMASAPHSLLPLLIPRARRHQPLAAGALELTLRRVYECFNGERLVPRPAAAGLELKLKLKSHGEGLVQVLACLTTPEQVQGAVYGLLPALETSGPAALELILDASPGEDILKGLDRLLVDLSLQKALVRLTVTWDDETSHHPRHRSWTRREPGSLLQRDMLLQDIHPESARRLELWRLVEFELTRLPSDERIFAFLGRARQNPADEVIFVVAEVKSAPGVLAEAISDSEHLLDFEHAYLESMRVLRAEQARRPTSRRLEFNRLTFFIRPPLKLGQKDLLQLARPLEAPTRGLGIQKLVLRAQVSLEGQPYKDMEVVLANPTRNQLQIDFREPTQQPLRGLAAYQQAVIRARRLGLLYPYELIKMLRGEAVHVAQPHPDMIGGAFVEYDLDAPQGSTLVPVERPLGLNSATVVVGVVSHQTPRHPQGMTRVFIASDPTLSMGALAEPECRRIMAALDLAERLGVPVEWLPVSSGARIAMNSGTENLDWTAAVLRRIILFTQAGGEINLIVTGVNVGAQSYWNAEATMLQHTRGVLIMTPQASMVLTGKKALEYSGSVAADDERGIGGIDRVMGPNGQAQYVANSLAEAYHILFEHYRYTYKRRRDAHVPLFQTRDRVDRSILEAPYQGAEGFKTVGEIFSDATNPGRKRPFAIREVMRAVMDVDSSALERFQAMAEAETAVVWDAHLGGHAVCLIGFESRPIQRLGRIPMDGPDAWSGGTLYPASSKKVARAINAASGNRPVVVIANLSGFDGSPESMRRLQLEYGAEIGRAVVNFEGPLVFVVVGRYHGGAYVVFSKALNPNLTALALEGAFASVIGGAPAAAVVFPREVRQRALADARVKTAELALKNAPAGQRPRLREQLEVLTEKVALEKQGEVAAEFDRIHSVERAVKVGSLDAVITPERLRPAIIELLERARTPQP